MTRKFGLFLLAGGLSAVVNLLLRLALTPSVGFALSVVIAYVVGVAIAYVLSSRFVFVHATASRRRSLLGFGLVNIVSGGQTLLVSMLLRALLVELAVPPGGAELGAHFLALASTAVTSFFGHQIISFRELQP